MKLTDAIEDNRYSREEREELDHFTNLIIPAFAERNLEVVEQNLHKAREKNLDIALITLVFQQIRKKGKKAIP